jgi:hypothetical protein
MKFLGGPDRDYGKGELATGGTLLSYQVWLSVRNRTQDE